MEWKKLNLVLLGKRRAGKSSTRNTILNRRVFNNARFGETSEVNFNFSQFGCYTLLVVDGLECRDTDVDNKTYMTTLTKNMDTALAMCYGGVDAFLLVIKFGDRFIGEDIESLKVIFGDGFIKHMIVVITFGDHFCDAMEEQGTPDKSFHQWLWQWCWERHDNLLKKLYDDCEGRFVLFNNREKDEERNVAQIQEVAQHAEDLQSRHGRYTSQCFETAKYELGRFILNPKFPELVQEFQIKISLLVAAIEDLAARPSEEGQKRIRMVLKELREMLMKVEDYLNDPKKLTDFGKEPWETRTAKTARDWVETMYKSVGGAIAGLNPVGATVAVGDVVAAGINHLVLDDKDINQQQQKEIRNTKRP